MPGDEGIAMIRIFDVHAEKFRLDVLCCVFFVLLGHVMNRTQGSQIPLQRIASNLLRIAHGFDLCLRVHALRDPFGLPQTTKNP